MNADALLERLDAEIGQAETQLARLRTTRETLLELAGDAAPVRAPAPPGGPPPAPAPATQPVATPGKPQPPAAAAPAAAPGAKRRPRNGLPDAVAAVLLRGPATRVAIANEIGVGPTGIYEVLKLPFFEHTDPNNIRSPYQLSAAGLARYAPHRLPTTPPPPVMTPPPQPPASVAEAKAQVRAIAAAMDRLGLTTNVEKIAEEACLPTKVVHQRLLNNGPNALSPSMRYFRKSDSGLWGLTDRGRELLTTPA
jgi:hypothetical protein